MQATDLFLGLLTDQRLVTPEPFPLKADGLLPAESSFQAMFDKAREKSEIAMNSNNLAAVRQDNVERPAAKERPDRASADPPARDGTAASSRSGCRAGPAETTETAASSTQRADSPEARAQKFAQEQTDINRKLEALAERIEQEIAKGEETADEQLVEMLMQFLTLLLGAAQENPAGENADGSNLTVAMNMDPDSRIYQLLDMLLQGQQALDGEELEDVNILLKLAGDKGLLIPLSELVRSSGEPGTDAMNLSLQLTDPADSSKTLELDLTISAEGMKSAELVSLSDPALKESDLVMIIPIERLVAENATGADGKSLEALLAKAAQGSQVNLSSEEGMVATPAEEETAAGPVRVAVPLKSADGLDTAAPKILTADAMFLNSDEQLKALDMDAMAKELVTAGKDRREIFDRLQQLILERGSAGSDSLLIKKIGSSMFAMKDWLQNFSEQSKQESREWANAFLKDEAAPATNNADTSSRIGFLGRPVAQNAFTEALTGKTTAARAAPGQNVQESVMNQIVQRVSYTFMNGTDGEVRVILRPANLGDLHLKVRVEQDIVTAKFTASSHEVKAIIESNMNQLRQALDELGIKVGKFDVEVNTGMNDQPQNEAEDRTADAYSAEYGEGESDENSYGNTVQVDFDGISTYSVRGGVSANYSNHSYLA